MNQRESVHAMSQPTCHVDLQCTHEACGDKSGESQMPHINLKKKVKELPT